MASLKAGIVATVENPLCSVKCEPLTESNIVDCLPCKLRRAALSQRTPSAADESRPNSETLKLLQHPHPIVDGQQCAMGSYGYCVLDARAGLVNDVPAARRCTCAYLCVKTEWRAVRRAEPTAVALACGVCRKHRVWVCLDRARAQAYP